MSTATHPERIYICKHVGITGWPEINTRVKLSQTALDKIRGLAGIDHVYSSDACNVSFTFKASTRPHYSLSVTIMPAFTERELLPQVLVIVAEDIGVPLERLKLVKRHSDEHDPTYEWAIHEALMLRCAQLSRRNPVAPFAATREDVKQGVQLLQVDYRKRHDGHRIFTRASTVTGDVESSRGLAGNMVHTSSGYVHLSVIGVEPYAQSDYSWDKFTFTIVDTVDNRRQLVHWLLNQPFNPTAHAAATEIVENYPGDFTAKVVVKGGRLTAEVS